MTIHLFSEKAKKRLWQIAKVFLSTYFETECYGNTGCGVFKQGIQNWKDFCLKINITKGNDWILRIGVMASCQKLGIILENKVY